jgi:hypothetical protein
LAPCSKRFLDSILSKEASGGSHSGLGKVDGMMEAGRSRQDLSEIEIERRALFNRLVSGKPLAGNSMDFPNEIWGGSCNCSTNVINEMCLNMFSYASLIVMAVIATAILNFSAILQ